MCATYRFEGGATRLTVRARTTEGDYGDVRLTVVARIPPKKSAQVRSSLPVLRRGFCCLTPVSADVLQALTKTLISAKENIPCAIDTPLVAPWQRVGA